MYTGNTGSIQGEKKDRIPAMKTVLKYNCSVNKVTPSFYFIKIVNPFVLQQLIVILLYCVYKFNYIEKLYKNL